MGMDDVGISGCECCMSTKEGMEVVEEAEEAEAEAEAASDAALHALL